MAKKRMQAPSTRLKLGQAVLNAAQVVDTKRVQARLKEFAEVHRTYADAQRRVDEAEAKLDAEKLRLQHVETDQDEAIEQLARCLVADGQPRLNPFDAFGAEAPGRIKGMPPSDKVAATTTLVGALRRNQALPSATQDAVQRTEQAAKALEAALPPMAAIEAELLAARQMRDVIGQRWDDAIAVLRRRVRAATDEGAPGLYAALFESNRRPSKKPKAEAPQATAPPTPLPTPPTA